MTRRQRNVQRPWGGRGSGVLYGQDGSSVGRPLVMGLIVVGLLAILMFLVFRVCGGSSCEEIYCKADRNVAAPEGYELVSDVYSLKAGETGEGGGLVNFVLDDETADGRNLSFYQYIDSTQTWEPIGPATLDADGKSVTGTLPNLPPLLAVLRRLSAAGHVVAYLPAGQGLHKDAAGRITMLHTLDFTPGADGAVQGEVTAIQKNESFAHLPTLSANSATAGSVQAVTALLSTPGTRSGHVQQIAKKVADSQLAGIDIAYLDLPATDRTSFALFVSELGQVLHNQGKQLTLTLPPPIRTQERIDEGAYNWAELGKAADVLQIAPYRDQSTYRTAMPEILEHLTGLVAPAKLVLTVTPYATEKGQDGIRTMSLTEAMNIATNLKVRTTSDQKLTTNSNVDVVGTNIDKGENLTGIFWQPETACVTFTYKLNGGRTVWIENHFSLGFKLEFISRFKLGGVAVEDASDNVLLGNIWTALVPFISSGQPQLLQPNPKDLDPRWKTSKGLFEDTGKGLIHWQTPAESGTYTINLTLSDGVALFESEIPVNVQPRTSPSGTPAAGTPTG